MEGAAPSRLAFLFVSHNVSGIFDDVKGRLSEWVDGLAALVALRQTDFVALHLQEVGGTHWRDEGSLSAVADVIAALERRFPEFWSSGMFVNLDTCESPSRPSTFTALGSVYLVRRKTALSRVSLWRWASEDGPAGEFERLSDLPGPVQHPPGLPARYCRHARFPQSIYPEKADWSRKGRMLTRWRVDHLTAEGTARGRGSSGGNGAARGEILDLLNIHNFHDECNLRALHVFGGGAAAGPAAGQGTPAAAEHALPVFGGPAAGQGTAATAEHALDVLRAPAAAGGIHHPWNAINEAPAPPAINGAPGTSAIYEAPAAPGNQDAEEHITRNLPVGHPARLSPFAACRRRALSLVTNDLLALSAGLSPPPAVFLFGDFNFRLDLPAVIRLLCGDEGLRAVKAADPKQASLHLQTLGTAAGPVHTSPSGASTEMKGTGPMRTHHGTHYAEFKNGTHGLEHRNGTVGAEPELQNGTLGLEYQNGTLDAELNSGHAGAEAGTHVQHGNGRAGERAGTEADAASGVLQDRTSASKFDAGECPVAQAGVEAAAAAGVTEIDIIPASKVHLGERVRSEAGAEASAAAGALQDSCPASEVDVRGRAVAEAGAAAVVVDNNLIPASKLHLGRKCFRLGEPRLIGRHLLELRTLDIEPSMQAEAHGAHGAVRASIVNGQAREGYPLPLLEASMQAEPHGAQAEDVRRSMPHGQVGEGQSCPCLQLEAPGGMPLHEPPCSMAHEPPCGIPPHDEPRRGMPLHQPPPGMPLHEAPRGMPLHEAPRGMPLHELPVRFAPTYAYEPHGAAHSPDSAASGSPAEARAAKRRRGGEDLRQRLLAPGRPTEDRNGAAEGNGAGYHGHNGSRVCETVPRAANGRVDLPSGGGGGGRERPMGEAWCADLGSKRCPAWCDRVLMNGVGMALVRASGEEPIYGAEMQGRVIADHNKVYLHFTCG